MTRQCANLMYKETNQMWCVAHAAHIINSISIYIKAGIFSLSHDKMSILFAICIYLMFITLHLDDKSLTTPSMHMEHSCASNQNRLNINMIRLVRFAIRVPLDDEDQQKTIFQYFFHPTTSTKTHSDTCIFITCFKSRLYIFGWQMTSCYISICIEPTPVLGIPCLICLK